MRDLLGGLPTLPMEASVAAHCPWDSVWYEPQMPGQPLVLCPHRNGDLGLLAMGSNPITVKENKQHLRASRLLPSGVCRRGGFRWLQPSQQEGPPLTSKMSRAGGGWHLPALSPKGHLTSTVRGSKLRSPKLPVTPSRAV